MPPIWTYSLLSVGHLLILTILWNLTLDASFAERILTFGIYCTLGAWSYSWQFAQFKPHSNLRSKTLFYLLGTALLLFSTGFLWRVSVEVVEFNLPLVVQDPLRLALLSIGYLLTATVFHLLLSYWTLSYPPLRPSRALLTAPDPNLNTLRDLLEKKQFRSTTSILSESLSPFNNESSKEPLRNHPAGGYESTRAGSNPRSKARASGSFSNGPRNPKGTPEFLESFLRSRLKKIQESFSAMTGLSLFSYNSRAEVILEPSQENPICRLVQSSLKGEQHCRSHCGKSIGHSLQGREPIFFQCDMGLHVFTVPVLMDPSQPENNLALLGGKVFFTPLEFNRGLDIAESLDIRSKDLSQLRQTIRVSENQTLVSSARFLESILPYLLATLYENSRATEKSSRIMALFNLLSQFGDESSLKYHAPSLLNTLGILFGLQSASIMLLDPEEKRYRTEAVFGQKSDKIHKYCPSLDTPLIQLLQGEMEPIFSNDTREILNSGLSLDISSVQLFPLLIQNGMNQAILGIFNSTLSEEEVSIIFIFCQQIAIYQELMRLRIERQDLTKDMSILLEIAKSAGSALDSEDLFNIILEKSTGFLEAEQGSLMILDEDRQELKVKAMKGLNKKIVELLRIRPGEGIAGMVLSTGQPILVSHMEDDERIIQDKRPRYRTQSFISIPLRLNGRVFGVLNIADKITGDPFSEEDLHLLVSIGAYASVAIQRSQLYHKTEELKKISITDELTSLLNRRYFQERISEEMERSRRHHLPLSLIMMDMDNFKSINDTFGHVIGDEVLKVAARCLRNFIRTIDVAARYGGEEFTVILPQTGKADAKVIADRICHEISKLDFPFEQADIPLTVSLGLATFPEDADSIEELIRNADLALYQAKTQGKNQVIAYRGPSEF